MASMRAVPSSSRMRAMLHRRPRTVTMGWGVLRRLMCPPSALRLVRGRRQHQPPVLARKGVRRATSGPGRDRTQLRAGKRGENERAKLRAHRKSTKARSCQSTFHSIRSASTPSVTNQVPISSSPTAACRRRSVVTNAGQAHSPQPNPGHTPRQRRRSGALAPEYTSFFTPHPSGPTHPLRFAPVNILSGARLGLQFPPSNMRKLR